MELFFTRATLLVLFFELVAGKVLAAKPKASAEQHWHSMSAVSPTLCPLSRDRGGQDLGRGHN